MKTYPTKEDVEKHKTQLEIGLSRYLQYGNIDLVKNDLRVLFTDIVLKLNNLGIERKGQENFDKFIELLNQRKKRLFR